MRGRGMNVRIENAAGLDSTNIVAPTARRPLASRLLAGGAALAMGVFSSTGAWAQCADNFNLAAIIPGVGLQPVQRLVPLGTGPSLGALTSTINTVNTAFLTGTSAFVSAPGGPVPDQQGGGVWGRMIAGTAETSASSTGALTQGPINPPAPGFVPDGHPELQHDRQARLLGLPGRPGHLDPERRRHRGELALGCDRRLYRVRKPRIRRRQELTSTRLFGAVRLRRRPARSAPTPSCRSSASTRPTRRATSFSTARHAGISTRIA